MTNNPTSTLILGGTGRTGSLIAKHMADRRAHARTASRSGSDLLFDWDAPGTYARALEGVDRVYLVPPVMRTRYADQVANFLDEAQRVGVLHVTLLSTYNGDKAPRDVDVAAVEAQLAARESFTHTILRPAWVMQNFADDHLPVVDGILTAPSGGGAEAFVDATDIAEVAVESLLNPHGHAGARYDLTGPQRLTFADAAETISAVVHRPIGYHDIDQEAWIGGAIAAGVPAAYAAMLRWLTTAIIEGNGSTPSGVVEAVLGRPATTFEEFAQRNASAWAPGEGR